MAISGIGTSFKLDNAADLLTDISTYLDGVDGSSDQDELDGTTFQPGVAVPIKNIIPGFATKGYSLSGKWSPASETFFSGIESRQGLDYEYGPGGTTVGATKITGKCACLSYTGPQSSVDGITTFSVELRVSSRTVATF
jgi:hypothetical protein